MSPDHPMTDADPATPTDPTIVELRRGLRPFQRRLWLRRLVYDGTRIAAVAVAAGLALAGASRLWPLEWAPLAAAGLLMAALLALLVDAARRRPSLAQTAMALDLSLIHISEPTRPY